MGFDCEKKRKEERDFPYKGCMAEGMEQPQLVLGVIIGLVWAIGIGTIGMRVNNNSTPRQPVGVPKHDVIEYNQGK
ncbi:hypothetical protein GCM10023189_45070 [Nibrella saemangeumensis]|uniref:Uncharacterized protein n=1 Tax=Nibrella saemangeumensis TaxID=1084526 RepID=A0ABP8NCG0_9BACT